MDFNRWWLNDPKEVYWLEITDRKDLGRDLNAPQLRDDGSEYYGYSLVKEANNGDIVLHYSKSRKSILAVSRVYGIAYEDTVRWAARGTTARGGNVQPYLRAGWRRALIDFEQIDVPVGLEQIRIVEEEIRNIRRDLEVKYGSLYFPFELSPNRSLRPGQAYFTKLPKAIVDVIPTMDEVLSNWQQSIHGIKSSIEKRNVSRKRVPNRIGETKTTYYVEEIGVPYRLADEEVSVSEYKLFGVDPALAERSRRSHASVQNTLANYLKSKGLEPRSPQSWEPNFDLAWSQSNRIFVAEIKSLTPDNEESQLRFGLGQLLRYRYALAQIYKDKEIKAILVPEVEPSDPSWTEICQGLDIILTWPEILSKSF